MSLSYKNAFPAQRLASRPHGCSLLVVQIWPVIATLETYLAGLYVTVLGGAIISGVIFLACFGLICSSSGWTLRFGNAEQPSPIAGYKCRPVTGYFGVSFSACQPTTSAVKIAPSAPMAISCGSKWGPWPGCGPVKLPTTLPWGSIFKIRPAIASAI